MTINEAIKELHAEYFSSGSSDWLFAIGADTPKNTTIHMYTKKKKFLVQKFDEYQGYKVEWHYTGNVRIGCD